VKPLAHISGQWMKPTPNGAAILAAREEVKKARSARRDRASKKGKAQEGMK
jgi:hypothetical protein